MLNREEWTQRVKALDNQEQEIAAANLPVEKLYGRRVDFPSELLIGEVARRMYILEDGFAAMSDTLQSIRDALNSPQD